MKRKIALLPFALAVSYISLPVMADQSTQDNGKVEAQVKAMHILGDAGNGYDPSEGTSYLGKLKYTTPTWKNLSAGIGFYVNGDLLNLTDFDAATETDNRLARGMFVTDDGKEKSQLGEMYLKYKINDMFSLVGGRQLYSTPLTKITYSTMPNFHTAYGLRAAPTNGLTIHADLVTQMSLGARSMTDYGLIGEGTQTAGAVKLPNSPGLGQAEFHDLSIIATGDDQDDTWGMAVLGATYDIAKNIQVSAWDYYADDISNTFYIDGSYGMKVGGMKMKIAAQFMNQRDVGDLVKDYNQGGTQNFADGIDYNLFGLKLALKGDKWMAFAGVNKSTGDSGMYNSWGGDPAYTSSIFSRNEYRENVTAYKVGAKYNFMKNLFVMVSHADYGQSDSKGAFRTNDGPTGILEADTDATEQDIVLVYKPMKGLMLKLFHARRTSEYDGTLSGREFTQRHTRLVAAYNF